MLVTFTTPTITIPRLEPIHLPFKQSTKLIIRASLVEQWLRICLLTQGTRVRALVWEDPTCRGATGPVSHNCWACASGACAPQRERPRQWEARAAMKSGPRSPQLEKALAQKRRSNTAKKINNKINKLKAKKPTNNYRAFQVLDIILSVYISYLFFLNNLIRWALLLTKLYNKKDRGLEEIHNLPMVAQLTWSGVTNFPPLKARDISFGLVEKNFPTEWKCTIFLFCLFLHYPELWGNDSILYLFLPISSFTDRHRNFPIEGDQ